MTSYCFYSSNMWKSWNKKRKKLIKIFYYYYNNNRTNGNHLETKLSVKAYSCHVIKNINL